MGGNLELRIRHPKGNNVLDTLFPNSSVDDLKREISKISSIPVSRISLKMGYPPQKVDLPENTTLENIGLQSGETIIAEENLNAEVKPNTTNTSNISSSNTASTSQNTNAQKTQPASTGKDQVPNPEGL